MIKQMGYQALGDIFYGPDSPNAGKVFWHGQGRKGVGSAIWDFFFASPGSAIGEDSFLVPMYDAWETGAKNWRRKMAQA